MYMKDKISFDKKGLFSSYAIENIAVHRRVAKQKSTNQYRKIFYPHMLSLL